VEAVWKQLTPELLAQASTAQLEQLQSDLSNEFVKRALAAEDSSGAFAELGTETNPIQLVQLMLQLGDGAPLAVELEMIEDMLTLESLSQGLKLTSEQRASMKILSLRGAAGELFFVEGEEKFWIRVGGCRYQELHCRQLCFAPALLLKLLLLFFLDLFHMLK